MKRNPPFKSNAKYFMVTTTALSIVVLLVSSTDHLFGRELVLETLLFGGTLLILVFIKRRIYPSLRRLFRAFQQRRITVAAVPSVFHVCSLADLGLRLHLLHRFFVASGCLRLTRWNRRRMPRSNGRPSLRAITKRADALLPQVLIANVVYLGSCFSASRDGNESLPKFGRFVFIYLVYRLFEWLLSISG